VANTLAAMDPAKHLAYRYSKSRPAASPIKSMCGEFNFELLDNKFQLNFGVLNIGNEGSWYILLVSKLFYLQFPPIGHAFIEFMLVVASER
jgi:hypothetical protein